MSSKKIDALALRIEKELMCRLGERRNLVVACEAHGRSNVGLRKRTGEEYCRECADDGFPGELAFPNIDDISHRIARIAAEEFRVKP